MMKTSLIQKKKSNEKRKQNHSWAFGPYVAMNSEPCSEVGVPLFMRRDYLSSSATVPDIQCQLVGEEEEELQAKLKTGEIPTVPTSIETRINNLKGGGRPLYESERRFFGPRFGMDFSKVRIHDDTQAERSAQYVNARAFTLGHNIVFGAGEYAPNTFAGRKLLAHELMHSIQQRGAIKTGHIQRAESKAEQAKRLKEVNKAAATTAVAETKVSGAKPHWAKKLSSAHLTNLSKVINYLNTAIPDLKTGAKKVDGAIASLKNAIKNFNEMRQKINLARAQGSGEVGITIQYCGKAKNAVDLAAKLLKESKAKGINGLDK